MKNRESNSYLAISTGAVAGLTVGIGIAIGSVYKTRELAAEKFEEVLRDKELMEELLQEVIDAQAEELRKHAEQALLEPCDKSQFAALKEAAALAREAEKEATAQLLNLSSDLIEPPDAATLQQVFSTVDEHYAYCPKEPRLTLMPSPGRTGFNDMHVETTLASTLMPESPNGTAVVLYYPETFVTPCELAASRVHESAHALGFEHFALFQSNDWIYSLDQAVQTVCNEKTNPSPETP